MEKTLTDFPKISVIVACLNEEKYIEKCISSLINQDYKGDFDIIIADGGSTDNTLEIIHKIQSTHKKIILIDNPNKIQASGRNLAINISDAEFVAYLDAHRYADKEWLSELWKCYSEFAEIDGRIIGVGSIHLDAANTPFSRSQETAFQSIISGATSSNFLNYKKPDKVSHACMCLYNKELLKLSGYYDENLPIGEDIELNHRLTYILGYNLYLNPKAENYYYPRENFSNLFLQQFNYGFWRQKVISKLESANESKSNSKLFSLMRLKTLIPGIFVATLIVLFILSFFSNLFFLIYYATVATYLLVLSIFSLLIFFRKKINPTILIIVFVAIHFGYGTGVLSYYLKLNKYR